MIDSRHPSDRDDASSSSPGDLLESVGKLTAGAIALWLFRAGGRRLLRGVRNRHVLRRLGIGVFVVVLAVTTCSYGVDPDRLTAGYGEPVPATREAASRLIQRASWAVRAASANGELRLVVTEEEATSALSLGLLMPELMRTMQNTSPEEIRAASTVPELRELLHERRRSARPAVGWVGRIFDAIDPELRTGDTQVRFTDEGEIVVGGYIQAWSFRLPGLMVVRPRASSGELELDFVEGRLGRLPAPEWVFDRFGEAVAGLVLMGRDRVEISDIRVERGRLVFAGRLAP